MTQIIHDNTFQTFPMIISLVQEKSEAPHLKWTSISTNLRACDHAGDKVAFVFLLPLNILLIPLEIIRYLFLALFYCFCTRKEANPAIEDTQIQGAEAALEEGSCDGKTIVTQAMYDGLQAEYARAVAQNRKFKMMLSLCNRALEKEADLREAVLEECNDPKWTDDECQANCPAPMADWGLVTQSLDLLEPDSTCGENVPVSEPLPMLTREGYAQLLADRTEMPDECAMGENVVQKEDLIDDMALSLFEDAKRQIIDLHRLGDEPVHDGLMTVSLICHPDPENMIRLGQQDIALIREKYPVLLHLFLLNSDFAKKNSPRLNITPEDMALLVQHSGGKIALVELDPPDNEAVDPSMYFEIELNGVTTLDEYAIHFNDSNDEVLHSILVKL